MRWRFDALWNWRIGLVMRWRSCDILVDEQCCDFANLRWAQLRASGDWWIEML